jgi:hypothetical protein
MLDPSTWDHVRAASAIASPRAESEWLRGLER